MTVNNRKEIKREGGLNYQKIGRENSIGFRISVCKVKIREEDSFSMGNQQAG
jgi:hypothetical protein